MALPEIGKLYRSKEIPKGESDYRYVKPVRFFPDPRNPGHIRIEQEVQANGKHTTITESNFWRVYTDPEDKSVLADVSPGANVLFIQEAVRAGEQVTNMLLQIAVSHGLKLDLDSLPALRKEVLKLPRGRAGAAPARSQASQGQAPQAPQAQAPSAQPPPASAPKPARKPRRRSRKPPEPIPEEVPTDDEPPLRGRVLKKAKRRR